MSVLLLVASEVSGVSPDQVQQPEGNVRRAVTRVELQDRPKEEGLKCFSTGLSHIKTLTYNTLIIQTDVTSEHKTSHKGQFDEIESYTSK